MELSVRKLALFLTVVILSAPLTAQSPQADRNAVLAVVDSAMKRISRNDFAALADLMLDEGMTYRVATAGDPTRYGADSREATARVVPHQNLTERGFDPVVTISGRMASVWLPYDFHIDGKWSHCGVDLFTMLKVGERWRIAVLAWTVEQPPACRPHPAGPPR
jgi:hypothetical protein